jgi:flavin reductase (DIM6/NTAB) family NADH-FMN oxidoreductase RutF
MTDSELADVAEALGRVPSGLFILTARHGARETGVLISWVQQCAFEPPQLTVCVRQGRDVLAWLSDGAAVTINVVGEGQKKFLSHFGKGFGLDENAFAGLAVERIDGEAPVLTETLAHLRCRIAGRISSGDHEVFLVTIVGGKMHRPGEPYFHARKSGLKY